MSELVISDLRAGVGGITILNGVDLTIRSGEVHAVMGPNGAGKSTLSHVVMGKPGYEVLSGSVTLDGVDLLALPTWQRAQAGLFLAMQYPIEVPGVSLIDLIEASHAGADGSSGGETRDALAEKLRAEAARIGFDDNLLDRALNVDMSGGEKKRNETLQLAVLRPAFAVLDELDSGLDIDALRQVARRVEAATEEDQLGVLVITHYSRLLTELRPDHVHVLAAGRIVASGGPELADELEGSGYASYVELEGEEPMAASAAAADPFADPFADPLA
ncbi:MAG: Fe-S cluster assembly ATPase SufC [Actinomycetia bacterium]|nr:Fe-S cluster assembly ATPase SufC [Actinomycetes bacterium]MCP5032381.1 Fe-S cluster assembly ATPase SufC [Actinomycetes bacterium]